MVYGVRWRKVGMRYGWRERTDSGSGSLACYWFLWPTCGWVGACTRRSLTLFCSLSCPSHPTLSLSLSLFLYDLLPHSSLAQSLAFSAYYPFPPLSLPLIFFPWLHSLISRSHSVYLSPQCLSLSLSLSQPLTPLTPWRNTSLSSQLIPDLPTRSLVRHSLKLTEFIIHFPAPPPLASPSRCRDVTCVWDFFVRRKTRTSLLLTMPFEALIVYVFDYHFFSYLFLGSWGGVPGYREMYRSMPRVYRWGNRWAGSPIAFTCPALPDLHLPVAPK